MRDISFDTYLRALALFTMANQHYAECRKFELSLAKLLNVEPGSHVSDAIYDATSLRSDFDEALQRENILVAAPKSQ